MTDRSFLQNALKIVEFSLDHPKLISFAALFLVIVFGIQLPKIKVDTDPENMLSESEFVRVFHNDVKKRFTLNDILVLGIVNEKHPDGVFNPDTLAKVFRITEEVKKMDGVVTQDIISPSTSDNIRQGGPGTVKFEWLMPSPPHDQNSARQIRKEAQDNPLLEGTLVSEDGRALALYIPLRKKSLSYRVASQIREVIAGLGGDEDYYITGLPVAEDTFGVEMFKQMAISAPLAGLIIFLLMWWFFRKVTLVISPMLTAIASIVITMGLLIGAGFTVHIMSSMIPIFLMPISVVDSVHILSVFFDKYQSIGDRRETMLTVMQELFRPMLFTSLTSAAGFASLALTPIPPVRVFGLFVAFGIMLAWVLTITFIPAYTMFIRESSLKTFGVAREDGSSGTFLGRVLHRLGGFAYGWAKLILVAAVILLLLAGWGISRINVNDNPVKWFTERHPIRIADDVLNRHFGGTYMAYLVVQERLGKEGFVQVVSGIRRRLLEKAKEARKETPNLSAAAGRVAKLLETQESRRIQDRNFDVVSMLAEAIAYADKQATAAGADEAEAWDETLDFLEVERVRAQTFKQPEVLRYLEGLQKAMGASGIVGKSNSVVDLVKKVHYELREGDKRFNIVPETANAVSQTLITFQNSHDPDDLWHLVTPDYASANIWAQLRSGDNQDMERVVRAVKAYVAKNPPPRNLNFQWAGLTYLNVVWQERMVYGMFWSLIGSFVIVLVMMIFLFRSLPWGLLAMVPLSLTITLVYGVIGFAGKDYDMPIAVLSSLTLGLSVDFAIHFLERARQLRGEAGSWQKATELVFGDPARAITRNALVIAIGFLPLLAAPLVPYQTVGFFLAAIMAVSAVGTLVILPPLIKFLEGLLFREPRALAYMCNCWTCAGSAVAAVIIATYVLHHYAILEWSVLTWVAIILVGLAVLACYRLSRLRNREAPEDAQ